MRKQLISAVAAILLGIVTTATGTIAFARGGSLGGEGDIGGSGGGGRIGGLGGGGHIGGFGGGSHGFGGNGLGGLRGVTGHAGLGDLETARRTTPASEATVSRRGALVSEATGSQWAMAGSATIVSKTVALVEAFMLTAPSVDRVRPGPIPAFANRTDTRMVVTTTSL
jgi:hypothetical protein